MGDEKKTIKFRRLPPPLPPPPQFKVIPLLSMSLNYMSISLFHRIIEIADEVDDLTRVRVNTLELTHLIDNIDDVIEKEEMEEKEEVEEKVKIIGSRP